MALKTPIKTPALNCTEIWIKRFVLMGGVGPNGKVGKVQGIIVASPYDSAKEMCAPQEIEIHIHDFRTFSQKMATERRNPLFLNAFNTGGEGASVVACVEWLLENEILEDMQQYVTVMPDSWKLYETDKDNQPTSKVEE